MITAAVMSTNSVPATPTLTNSDTLFTIAPVLCGGGVVGAAIVVTDTGGVATDSEGKDVGFELESVTEFHDYQRIIRQ